MHQTQRRQCTNYFSLAASTNRNQHNPSPHHPPTNRRPGAAQSEEDTEELGRDIRSDDCSVIGKKSSNVLMTSESVGGAGELHGVSSFGSCSTWNTLDACPATPSPVCSSRSAEDDDTFFTTPDQSSCIISNGGGEKEEEASRGKTRQESRKVATNHNCSMKREGHGSSKSRLKETRCVRPSTRGRVIYEPDSALTANRYNDDGKLPAVSEDRQVDSRGCNQSCCLTMSSHISSGSDDQGSGRYENSDMESYALTVHQRRVRGSGTKFVAAENGRNTLEEKVTAWKEARMMKLMDKLRRDEAAIDKWEMKKTAEAKNNAKQVETKLDKKWSRELKRMQRRIRDAQEEAEKRKVRERAVAAGKIEKVTKAFERTAVTGKLPWWFRFL